jgi:biotin operon repressor
MLTKNTNKSRTKIWDEIIAPNVHSLILLAIVQAGENGISGKDLEQRTGVSRITIWKQRARLRDDGLVYYQTKGKRTKYYPTELAISDLQFRSWIRYNELFRLLESQRISLSSPFYNIELPNYFDCKTERTLLEFSLKIGILVTYILVQHLTPIKVKKLKYKQGIDPSKIANKLINESVINILSPVKMLIVLRQSLYRLGHQFLISNAKKSSGLSFYAMSSKSYDDVLSAFERVFPQAYKEFQAINFENSEYYIKKRIEQAKTRREQLKCKHKYQIAIKDKIESYTCSICKFTSKINLDTIISNSEVIQKLNSMRPPSDNCKDHRWQVWSDNIHLVSLRCLLCDKIAELPIESEEKLDAIREEVETDDRLDLKNSTEICEDIEIFFHHHSNRRLTVNHYIKYYEQHHITKKIVDLGTFTNEVEILFEILAKNGYIENIADKKANKLIGHIRRENIEIKSVTGRKLLTLAAV